MHLLFPLGRQLRLGYRCKPGSLPARGHCRSQRWRSRSKRETWTPTPWRRIFRYDSARHVRVHSHSHTCISYHTTPHHHYYYYVIISPSQFYSPSGPPSYSVLTTLIVLELIVRTRTFEHTHTREPEHTDTPHANQSTQSHHTQVKRPESITAASVYSARVRKVRSSTRDCRCRRTRSRDGTGQPLESRSSKRLHRSLRASRSDSRSVRMSPSRTGPCKWQPRTRWYEREEHL